MKRIFLSFLCLCLLMSIGVTAYAANSSGDDAVIDTVVPDSHTITVIITGKGSVLRDDMAVGGSITMARHEDLLLVLTPDKGFTLSKVIYNGVDVTDDVLSGCITLGCISSDVTLEVVFISDPKGDTPKGDTPKTGDESNMTLWGAMLAVSSLCLLITVKGKKRKKLKRFKCH